MRWMNDLRMGKLIRYEMNDWFKDGYGIISKDNVMNIKKKNYNMISRIVYKYRCICKYI